MILISELNSRVKLLLYGCHNYMEQIPYYAFIICKALHILTTLAQSLENNRLHLRCALHLLSVILTRRVY